MYSSYPDPHSPRVAYYRAQRRGYAVASGYPEAPSPRLAHSQQHGLVARPERLTSPGPAHPYHASRSYHSHSADSTFASYPSAQHRRAAEDDIRMARRGSASQLLHSHDQRHHYPPLSPQPQPRYPRDSTHARTHTHGSPEHAFDGHGSLERMQGQGLDGRDLAAAARAAYDGRWDAESLHRMRRRRGDYETISEPQSASLASAAAAPHRREVQRGIRPSVSESDLASAELKRDRERRMGGPLGEEAAAVDVGEDRLDDEEELAYRRMHFAGSYPLHHLLDDPRHHMSREEYMYAQQQQQQQQHLRHLRYPYHHEQQHPAHHEQHHAPYLHEYDPHYDPQRHAQRGGAALADGHPSSQCTQAGSSSSLSADQQQKQKQQQQQQKQQKKQSSAATSGAPTGASSGVPSGASSQPRPNNPMQGNFPPRMLPPLHPRDLPTLLPYHTTRPGSNNGQQPKMPMRRGPYLSKQRALLAGYELPSPSSRYQCQYCSKRFSRPSSLRIHTYSHTGERPFKCSEEGCGRQFSVQSNMRRHLRVHRMGRMRSEYADPEQEQEQDQQQESEHENENEHEDEQDFE
ncbi:hypothetical protein BGX23_002004 [Mortierella sp. AD031]|nr:hypothetical protein BGX23_002004 [Mortierella sp. AD031]